MKYGIALVPVTLITLAAAAAGTSCTPSDADNEARGQAASQAKKGGGPPGNNGTVKIQEAGAPDEIPDNDPHVGCIFNIEFRGYDEGDLEATWTLTAHPPSGSGTVIANGAVDIGEDPAGGAPDLDAVVTVNIGNYDLSGLTRHPVQGYHLKLEVHAEGSIGADKKHKVFWVDGCGTDAGSSSGGSSSGGSSSGGSSSGGSSSGGTPDAGGSSSGGSSGKTW